MFEIRVDWQNEKTIIRLKGEMTIEHASEVKEKIRGTLETGTKFEIDASEVTACDLSFFQLLCAACKLLQQTDKTIRFIEGHVPDIVTKRVGISGYFYKQGCASNPDKPCLFAPLQEEV